MSKDLPKILCVDDEEGILDALERTLRRRFTVLTAVSPEEGEKMLDQHKDITVTISDHIMGTQTGVEFLSKVKAKLPNCGRVLLSGQIDIKSMEEAINNAEVHKFIMKPWENDHLLLQIMAAFRIHKTLEEKERLRALSITDPVTDLTNHRFFQERVRLEWDKSEKSKAPLSLIMVDIDHFKKFNDRFGHPEGDRILSLVAQELREKIPQGGSISRYGGEEFSAILPKMDAEDARVVAEKMRQRILEIASEQQYPLSISLGVATFPDHAQSVDELIISADQSLYQAKRQGRNQTVVGLASEA